MYKYKKLCVMIKFVIFNLDLLKYKFIKMRITHSPSSKFRPSPSKLQLEYSNKLELIDKHIRKSD